MRWWVVAVAVVGVMGCGLMEKPPLSHRDISGRVVFESYRLNLSGGYRLTGWYIDGDGDVWAYDHSDVPWHPESLRPSQLTEHDLAGKYAGARQVGTVDRAQLLAMARLVEPCSRARVLRPARASDASGATTVAYLFESETATYREVVLAGTGDRVARNTAPEAQRILEWLRSVERELRLAS